MAKAMIVDDAPFMRLVVKNIMLELGLEVVGEASTGEEAAKLYPIVKPDIVTMDITMPDMNGIEAVQQIMKLDPAAKIIMCSAIGQHRMVLDAIHAGAKDFVVKPIEKKRFIESVVCVLKLNKE
ncbi:response regulator [Paenibacillus chartarius]|uniref:Response regulator n=1 Tax=Paenibacillus chartarius TaxID=747481 RepID=A0ABV6DLS0_9BACL